MPHVAILVHRNDDFEGLGYCLTGVVRFWREAGLEVEVYDEPGRAKDADVAILHVDLTVVPAEYLSLAARYPKCLNRFTSDISKRAISRQLVRRGDGFAGPVMVKSNLNSGGGLEALGAGHARSAVLLPRAFTDYQVFERSEQVPEFVWSDSGLAVEKFLPEREGERYCVRLWVFLGSREINYRCQAEVPVVKGSNTVSREIVEWVPDDLRQMREELGFDYGKFDYGVVDGRAVLYDANRTPTYGTKLTPEQIMQRDQAISGGIWDFLPPR